MKMNRAQRIVLWCGVGLIMLNGLVLPYDRFREGRFYSFMGYYLFFAPPQFDARSRPVQIPAWAVDADGKSGEGRVGYLTPDTVRINTARFFIQVFTIGSATAVLFFLFKDRREKAVKTEIELKTPEGNSLN